MPDDERLAQLFNRIEVLLQNHETPTIKPASLVSIIAPGVALLIALISFYVLTTDRLGRLESYDKQIEEKIGAIQARLEALDRQIERTLQQHENRLERIEKK